MTATQMLARFRAEIDRYGIASGAGSNDVYLRTSPLPASGTEVKALFTSPHQSDCEDWIAARAMAAVKRAIGGAPRC